MNGQMKLQMLFLSEVLPKFRNRKEIVSLAQLPTKFMLLKSHPHLPSARLMFCVNFKLDRMTLSPWSGGLAFCLNRQIWRWCLAVDRVWVKPGALSEDENLRIYVMRPTQQTFIAVTPENVKTQGSHRYNHICPLVCLNYSCLLLCLKRWNILRKDHQSSEDRFPE